MSSEKWKQKLSLAKSHFLKKWTIEVSQLLFENRIYRLSLLLVVRSVELALFQEGIDQPYQLSRG